MRVLSYRPAALATISMLIGASLLGCEPKGAKGTAPGISEESAGGADTVVVINGETVTRAQYEDALFAKYGSNFLETFIEDRLLAQEAKTQGVTVDQTKVDAKVKKDIDSLLQTRFNGKQEALEHALGERGMSLDGWKKDLAARAQRDQLLEALIKKKRGASSEAVKKKFAQKYGDDGVKYRIRHILISTKVVNSKFYSKKEFEAESAKVDTELKKLAQDIYTQLKGGADFAEVAKANSDDFTANRGGDLGESWKGRFGQAFDDTVAKLPVGQISTPFKGRRGYHVVEVTKIRKGVQYKGRAILVSTGPNGPSDSRSPEDRTKAAQDKIKEIKAALASGTDFAKVATEFSDDLATKSRGGDLGTFGRRRLGDDVDKVLETAKAGTVTEPIKTRRGFWIVELTAKKMTPAEDKKVVRHVFVSTEYDKVKKRRLKDGLDAMAKAKADKLAAEINAGTDFADLAEKESEDAYTRKTGGEYLNYRKTSLGNEVWDAVQKMKAGKAVTVVKSSRGYHVLNVIEKKVTKFDDVKAELLAELNKQPTNPADAKRFLKELKDAAKIDRKIGVNPPAATPAPAKAIPTKKLGGGLKNKALPIGKPPRADKPATPDKPAPAVPAKPKPSGKTPPAKTPAP